jgi:SAM-dependent methyltransferase
LSSESEIKKGFAEGFWSDEEIKELFLEKQREFMWNDDYWRNVLVPLFNLRYDSTVLDVGCGLGFLARKLAEHHPKGKSIGVDLDPKLVESAKKVAQKIFPNHAFDFRVGNAYELPVESESVDLTICQCVLMHLEEPLKALHEMQRVTKKGGRVVAIEPDYGSVSFFDSAFEKMGYSVDDRAKFWRWELQRRIGKKKLGKGDDDIGSKLAPLFFQSGLRVVDVRCFDRVFWLIPPYDRKGNDLELEQLLLPPEFYFEKLDARAEFLAGGGTEEEFKEYVSLMKKEHEIRQRQVKEKTYVASLTQALVIVIGEKI